MPSKHIFYMKYWLDNILFWLETATVRRQKYPVWQAHMAQRKYMWHLRRYLKGAAPR